MKRTVLTVLCLTLLASSASAAVIDRAIGDKSIGPVAGFTLPTGDFGDLAGNGYALGVTGDYVLMDILALGGDIVWNPYGEETFLGSDFSYSMMHFTAHAKFYFPPEPGSQFFGVAKLGMYRASVESTIENPFTNEKETIDASDSEIGLALGVGGEFPVGGNNVTVEAGYHLVSDLNFFMISAAVLFGVGGN